MSNHTFTVLGGKGDTVTRTEYWLMFERPDGKVRRWFSFTEMQTARDAIPDADNTVRATRWGVKTVQVTHTSLTDIEWVEPA